MRTWIVAFAFVALALAGLEDLTCKIDNTAFPTVSGTVNYVSPNEINWWFSGSQLATGYFRWHIHNYQMNHYSDVTTAGAHFNLTQNSIGELSNMFGNIPQTPNATSVSSGANCNAPIAFPTVPAYPIAGRSITLHGAAGARISCCTIGFYASNAGSTLRCEFNKNDQNVNGYIDITATQVITNLTIIRNNQLNLAFSWHIHEYQAYPWNSCATTGGHYAPVGAPGNYSELATLCGNLQGGQSGTVVLQTCNTTMFAGVVSPLQIAGRSTMLHFTNASATFAGCSIGYYNGTNTGPTCAPATTTRPAATTPAGGLVPTTDSPAVALSASVALVLAIIAALLL